MTFECIHVQQGAPLDSTVTLIIVPHHAQAVPSHFGRDGEPFTRMVRVCDQCALKAANLTVGMLEP